MRTRVRIRQGEGPRYHLEVSPDDGATWIDVPVGDVKLEVSPGAPMRATATFFDVVVDYPRHLLKAPRPT